MWRRYWGGGGEKQWEKEKEDCPRGRKGREGKQLLSGLTHLILNLLNHLPSTCSVLSLWRVPLPQDEDSTRPPQPQLPAIIPQRRQPLAALMSPAHLLP